MSATRFVLVTGASRGLGRDMALHLVRNGFAVLAGVRADADGRRLAGEGGAGILPLLLDVTDRTGIRNAVEQVEQRVGAPGLAGLVNNAGIASFGPLEQQPMDEFEAIFRVNVFGVQALTQAVLPALRRARGRVVNISSGNGRLALPHSGAYSASKFALEAMSDALRMEVAPWGIRVVVVEPGAMATDIRLRAIDTLAAQQAALPEADRPLYAGQVAALSAAIRGMEAAAGPAGEISEAVLEALTAAEPQTRYPVGPFMDQLGALAVMPDRERDRFALGVLGLGEGAVPPGQDS
jgi:NAD(P)-dependent dehydrogenase (short-subunit alcohol dehydrogenase family)